MYALRASLAIVGLVCTTAVGCSSEPPPPPMPPPQPPPAPIAAPAPTPTAAPAPATETGPCNAVLQVQLQSAIGERKKTQLSPGMKPDGAFTCQLVAEGQNVAVPFTMQPGKCYSVLAHSLPNVTEVDIFLKPNLGPNPSPLLLPFASLIGAQDSETGPVASIGSGGNCIKNALAIPGPALAEVVARAGAGPIAVQVYSK